MKNPTSSCSSSISGWTYDVFLSFRGDDTRSGFTGNLFKALCDTKEVKVFIDDKDLKPGKEITPALIEAIQESRIALVIFSKNYASSTFCLEELANIVECSKDNGMLVWPVFYLLDAAVVRYQKGSYDEALAKHEARFEKDKIEKWRAALKIAADKSGSQFSSDQYEYVFIETITEQVTRRLKEEPEEKKEKRMEKGEAHLFTIIKVARDADLYEQIGEDIFFDLVDHDKVRSFWIRKQDPFIIFKEEVAREFGIPVMYQRFWLWAKRRNHTYRPLRPLTPQEETQPVGQLTEVSKKANNAELKLYLEMEKGLDFRPIHLPEKSKEDLLLFFKLYDPSHEKLRYIGRFHVKASGKPRDILTRLNEMAGFAIDGEIELFEEIKFEPNVMCEHVDKNSTFRASQIEDGDIICFQKAFEVRSGKQFRYPDVPSFMEYVHNRQMVHFRFLEKPKEYQFSLELSKIHTHDEVVIRVARRLGLDDPSKIRLTSHNCYTGQPKSKPIKYQEVEHLSDMLVRNNQTSDILYYEVLDIPLPELQCLKTLKIAFRHATKEVVIRTIRLPKQSAVEHLINDLRSQVDLSHPGAELRLLEVFYHKIYKVFSPNELIENISDEHWTIRAEEIPEEEKNLGPNDRLIHVCHFMKYTVQNQLKIHNFGDPFLLVIHEDETLADIKIGIQKELQVPDDEFLKWKFAVVSLGHPAYLQDSDIVCTRFQRDIFDLAEQYLGLEHAGNDPAGSYKACQAYTY